MRTPRVTDKMMERALKALKTAFSGYFYDEDTDGPVEGWVDGFGNQVHHSIDENGVGRIAWEGGPHAWTYLFPYGGVDEEMTYEGRVFNPEYVSRIKDVSGSSALKGLFVEAETHYSVNVYREG